MSDNGPLQPPELEMIHGHMSNQSLPPEVQENFKRHHENLTRLADNLKNIGMDQQAIDGHVLEIFKEYERELAANIQRIKAAGETRRIKRVG